ncbi:hypothetical protein L580_2719 [Serratia fonticola AU-P3(3)]|nr:hypothetical protein L580_2719 [Serratia fonticola AU-P3(3)]
MQHPLQIGQLVTPIAVVQCNVNAKIYGRFSPFLMSAI